MHLGSTIVLQIRGASYALMHQMHGMNQRRFTFTVLKLQQRHGGSEVGNAFGARFQMYKMFVFKTTPWCIVNLATANSLLQIFLMNVYRDFYVF